MAGIGIAKKGLGLLGKKKRGNFAMKNFKKRLQKTPNKKFREDKSYTLMEGTPHAKTYQHITSGKKQKKKILQQQQSIKRNWEATGHEWGPHKGGWKAKGGRIGFKKGKLIGMRTEAGKITDKRQRLYEQAHGEHFTTGLFGRKKSDASTGGGAPPPLRLLTGMKNYWQNKPDSLKQLRKFNKENPPPKDSKYQLKKGGRIGLQRGGGSAPFLRGRSGATNIKAPRGQQGWKQMQAAEAKIPSKGLRVVKGNPVRQDQAQRLRAHRLRTKIKGARAGRAKQAQQEAGTAKFYAKHPGAKTMFAKQKFGRQFRKAGKI